MKKTKMETEQEWLKQRIDECECFIKQRENLKEKKIMVALFCNILYKRLGEINEKEGQKK